ncbi:MAG: hypothetical protein K6U75_13820 [Firmicutes bacterium]|nr:hypothetical protein [Bacillota bacterium]
MQRVYSEALILTIALLRTTRRLSYRQLLFCVAPEVLSRFHDPDYGDYFETLDESCQPTHTYEGSAWKAAYHLTQAWWHVARNLYDTDMTCVL